MYAALILWKMLKKASSLECTQPPQRRWLSAWFEQKTFALFPAQTLTHWMALNHFPLPVLPCGKYQPGQLLLSRYQVDVPGWLQDRLQGHNMLEWGSFQDPEDKDIPSNRPKVQQPDTPSSTQPATAGTEETTLYVPPKRFTPALPSVPFCHPYILGAHLGFGQPDAPSGQVR